MAKAKHDPNDQVKAFRNAARELGCDDNEERFQEILRTIGKQKPKDAKERPQSK